MILEILEKFPDLIVGYEVEKFRMVGFSYELIVHIQLFPETVLHVFSSTLKG